MGSLDQQKIADYIRGKEHTTVVGKVRFGKNGEWAKTRALMVQFHDIKPNDMEQFTKAGTRPVLYPKEWKSGDLRYPYKQ